LCAFKSASLNKCRLVNNNLTRTLLFDMLRMVRILLLSYYFICIDVFLFASDAFYAYYDSLKTITILHAKVHELCQTEYVSVQLDFCKIKNDSLSYACLLANSPFDHRLRRCHSRNCPETGNVDFQLV
jgi:hypothetical protein